MEQQQSGIHITFGDYNRGLQLAQNFGQINIAPERPETPPEPFSNVPYRRDPQFVERPILIEQIRSKLSEPGGRAALVGLGGIGKSQLAIEYARQLRQKSPQTWIFWVRASSVTGFNHSISEVTDALRLSGRQDPKANHLQLLRNWLCDRRKGNWLIVLDNADDTTFLLEPQAAPPPAEAQGVQSRIKYFPVCDHGSIIFTSRSRDSALKVVYDTDIINIQPMTEDEATKLLESKLGQTNPESGQLVKGLDCMPLAITQAAAYIRERGQHYTLQQYLKKIEEGPTSRTSLLRRSFPLPGRDVEASNSILLTWQISFEYVYEKRRTAADLFSLMSFCDRFAIPEILLIGNVIKGDLNTKKGKDTDRIENVEAGKDVEVQDTKTEYGHVEGKEPSLEQEGVESSPDFEEDIITLRNFSFISETAAAQVWEMHRLIQDAMQMWLRDSGRFHGIHGQFINQLDTLLASSDPSDPPVYRLLLPHVKHAAEQQPTEVDALPPWSRVAVWAALGAYSKGDCVSAAALAASTVKIVSKRLGEGNEWTLFSMEMLAMAYSQEDRWSEAEQLFVKILSHREDFLREEGSGTLSLMVKLAQVYQNQKQWKDAERLQFRILERRKATLGENHDLTLQSMDGLARLLEGQGRSSEAEELQVKVLSIKRATLGNENPSTLFSMNSLVVMLSRQRRFREAEELQREVLSTSQAMLGEEDMTTVCCMGYLAELLLGQGRWKEAEELLLKALDMETGTFGVEHQRTIRTMRNLAQAYEAQGRFTEAEQLFLEVLKAKIAMLGETNPEIPRVMNQLVMIYYQQSRWAEAEQLLRKVLNAQTSLYGEDHPSTIGTLQKLSHACFSQDRYEEAEKLQIRAVDGLMKNLDPEHPTTLNAISNLAKIRRTLERNPATHTGLQQSSRSNAQTSEPPTPRVDTASENSGRKSRWKWARISRDRGNM